MAILSESPMSVKKCGGDVGVWPAIEFTINDLGFTIDKKGGDNGGRCSGFISLGISALNSFLAGSG